jgi:hypothetical protein
MSNLTGKVAGIALGGVAAVGIAREGPLLVSEAGEAYRSVITLIRSESRLAKRPPPRRIGVAPAEGEFAGWQRLEDFRFERPPFTDLHYNPPPPLDKTLTSLLQRAEPDILKELSNLHQRGGSVTAPQVDELIRRELMSKLKPILETRAVEPKVKFEVLSGKLTVEASQTIFGIEFAGGSLNLWKVGGTLTAAVMACVGLEKSNFSDCTKEALTKIGSAVRDELKIDEPTTAKSSMNP